MADFSKGCRRRGADPLGRGIGGLQFGVLALDRKQFPHQAVVLRVGDERIVLLMVAAVVILDGFPELGGATPDGPGRGHDAVGSAACLSRVRMCAILPALSG